MKRARIDIELKKACFELFKQGFGYKATSTKTGLNRYTVRDYCRKYKKGDYSWVGR